MTLFVASLWTTRLVATLVLHFPCVQVRACDLALGDVTIPEVLEEPSWYFLDMPDKWPFLRSSLQGAGGAKYNWLMQVGFSCSSSSIKGTGSHSTVKTRTLDYQRLGECPQIFSEKVAAIDKKWHAWVVEHLTVRDLRLGLIVHYPFDGDARDHAGENGPLTVEHADLTTDRFGKQECAYQLDGIRSALRGDLKSFPDYRSSLSCSWWYYTREIQTYAVENGAGNMIVLAAPESGSGLQFGFRAPGYNTLGLDTWMWGGGTLLEVKPPAVNAWHHCAYTSDGKFKRFYVDATELANSTVGLQGGMPTQLMIGNYPTGDQFFRGKLDDIRIYNRALCRPEIELLYHATR